VCLCSTFSLSSCLALLLAAHAPPPLALRRLLLPLLPSPLPPSSPPPPPRFTPSPCHHDSRRCPRGYAHRPCRAHSLLPSAHHRRRQGARYLRHGAQAHLPRKRRSSLALSQGTLSRTIVRSASQRSALRRVCDRSLLFFAEMAVRVVSKWRFVVVDVVLVLCWRSSAPHRPGAQTTGAPTAYEGQYAAVAMGVRQTTATSGYCARASERDHDPSTTIEQQQQHSTNAGDACAWPLDHELDEAHRAARVFDGSRQRQVHPRANRCSEEAALVYLAQPELGRYVLDARL